MQICDYCGQQTRKRVDQSLLVVDGDKIFCDEFCKERYELCASKIEVVVDGDFVTDE